MTNFLQEALALAGILPYIYEASPEQKAEIVDRAYRTLQSVPLVLLLLLFVFAIRAVSQKLSRTWRLRQQS